MGFIDELKKLTRPYDDDDDELLDEAEVVEEPEERPRPNPFAGFGGGEKDSGASASASGFGSSARSGSFRPRESKVVNFSGGGGQTQVILVKPERFETAAEIADHLRAKRAVLVNLETTPKEVTRRLVDFLSGVTYAIDGNIKKVASNTYILTPPNVNLVGDGLDDLSSGGVYF